MTSPVVVDAFAGDFSGNPYIGALASIGYPYVGFEMKVSEGTWYPNSSNPKYSPDWIKKVWPEAREAGGDRYGVSWFRQPYHYANIAQSSAAAQAQWCEQVIQSAGGWGPGDLPLMLDMESGDNPPNPSTQQLVDFIGEFCAERTKIDRRPVILYGNIYLAEHGFTIGPKCGCPWLEVAHYLATLPASVYTRIGYDYASLYGWQYAGTEPQTEYLANYPHNSPAGLAYTNGAWSVFPRSDMTAVTIAGGGDAALQWMADHTYAKLAA